MNHRFAFLSIVTIGVVVLMLSVIWMTSNHLPESSSAQAHELYTDQQNARSSLVSSSEGMLTGSIPSGSRTQITSRLDPSTSITSGQELALEREVVDDNNPVFVDATTGTVAAAREHTRENSPIEEEFVDEVIEDHGDGTGQRRRIVRYPGNRYPYLRIKERWQINDAGEHVILQREEMIADHILVRFQDHIDFDQVQDFIKDQGIALRRRLGSSQRYLLSFPLENTDTIVNLIDRLNDDPIVAAIEKDYIYYSLGTQPDDPLFIKQWALQNTGQEFSDGVSGTAGADISAIDAWKVSTGSRSVAVAVIDSGIDYLHPDLAENIWRNPHEEENGLDDSGNGYIDDIRGWHFIRESNDVMPLNNHGTHVAGTIGAIGNNGTGVAGVAWNVSLAPLCISMASGSIPISAALEAIDYAAAMEFPISNNSWGGSAFSQELYDAVARTTEIGQLFIAAAGNDGRNNHNIDDDPVYPASFDLPNILRVAASDYNDKRPTFSNVGPETIQIAAPGQYIYSTMMRNNGLEGSDYGWMSGTSMAAPHVTGVAVLLLSINPNLTYQDMIDIITTTADEIEELEGTVQSGRRLNSHAAVASLASESVVVRQDDWLIHDGGDYGADGNGDGILNPGERIAVHLRVSNTGTIAAEDLIGTIEIVRGGNVVSIIGEDSLSFGNLGPNGQQDIGPFLIDIADDSPAFSSFSLQIVVNTNNGPQQAHQIHLNIWNSYPIAGHITLAYDGSPVEEQRVRIFSPNGIDIHTTTNADGFYEYIAIDGDYTVEVRREGYLTQTAEIHIPGLDHAVDFSLGRPRLVADNSPILIEIVEGGSASFPVTVENQGDMDLRWIAAGSQRDYELQYDHERPDFSYSWEDIREDGMQIFNMGDNTVSPWLQFLFPFALYDHGFQELVVCSNGFAAFTDDFIEDWLSRDGAPPGTWPIDFPSGELDEESRWNDVAARNALAFLWRNTDFTAGLRNGEAHFLAEEDRFIIQFSQVPHYSASDDEYAAWVQMVVRIDGSIEMRYKNFGDIRRRMRIGIQDHSRERGITAGRKTIGVGSVDDLIPSDKSALRFLPIDRFSMEQYPAILAPGASATAEVSIAAGDWEPGEHEATLILHSTDPETTGANGHRIPIQVTVVPAPVLKPGAWMVHDDGAHGSDGNGDGYINPGETIALTTVVENMGGAGSEGAEAELEVVHPATVSVENPIISLIEMAPGETAPVEAFRLNIGSDMADGEEILVRVRFTAENGGTQSFEQILTVRHSGFLRGVVRKGNGGDPIPGVEVHAHTQGVESIVYTEADGSYELVLFAGTAEVTFNHDDYSRQTHWPTFTSADLTLDIEMGTPQIDTEEQAISITIYQGETKSFAHTVGNIGDAMLRWTVSSDAWDYTIRHSGDPQDPIAYTWEDIRDGSEVPVSFPKDSNAVSHHLPLGMIIPYYGNGFSRGYFCANSVMSFTDNAWTSGFHASLPWEHDTGFSRPNMIGFGWRDHDIRLGGEAHYVVREDRFIFQFSDLQIASGTGAVTTSQLHLFPDGTIEMFFASIASSGHCTIGMQDAERERGVTYAYNASSLPNSEVRVRLQPEGGLVHFSNAHGRLAPSEEQDFTITVDARGQEIGEYEHVITIFSDDPNRPGVEIPITVTVVEADRVITLRGTDDEGAPRATYIQVWHDGIMIHEENEEGQETHKVDTLRRDQETILRLFEVIDLDSIDASG